ncbi:MAG: phosphomannomutase [Lentisphaerae bacterium RIFOXYB12_FULL_65_16]|nr:MAG: phosphomannomutase [Lentisphaerae bacterium RIFOXYA12_64_32]OGV90320.1 MAG: phosphomannomutase [Lentisphaerae bacterium RIFOXYB12_FULL_65_16]
MAGQLTCFKAYDIRGVVPTELNEDLAYALGRAYAQEVRPAGPVAVGRDVRLSSPGLAAALIRGLNEAGVDTCDIGQCGTEMVYFAAARPGMGGGIMVTASHNPREYNGMKLVRAAAVPISGDSGLPALERRVRTGRVGRLSRHRGADRCEDVLGAYVAKVLSFVDVKALKPFRVVANAGNGCAGPVLEALRPHLPFDMILMHESPDGTFPNGVPNPLLEENRGATSRAVLAAGADLGVAWDGDFDRCFFFDETGGFVDGYYLVGLLAAHLLRAVPGARIIHDPRMTWNTVDVVRAAGGIPLQGKTGHAFMKERMRAEDALYGGEMSAHHYFRDFAYCDTGMIPWLVLSAVLSGTDRRLSALIRERRALFPGSGEVNRRVAAPDQVIARARTMYAPLATRTEWMDGLSMEFGGRWRFNLRRSQTEPILRLNVESRGDPELMRRSTEDLLRLMVDPDGQG